MKVKVISLPYIFQVLDVFCFTRQRYQVSVYRTNGPPVNYFVHIEQIFQFQLIYVLSNIVFLQLNDNNNKNSLFIFEGLRPITYISIVMHNLSDASK